MFRKLDRGLCTKHRRKRLRRHARQLRLAFRCVLRPVVLFPGSPFSSVRVRPLLQAQVPGPRFAPASGVRCTLRGSRLRARVLLELALDLELYLPAQRVPEAVLVARLVALVSVMFRVA